MTAVAERGSDGSASEGEPHAESLARRVDDAMRAMSTLDPAARAVAEEVKASVEAIHRAGLVSIVRRLKGGEATREALFELVDDPVVHLLLSLHGIVRPDPMTLAGRVLDGVRPQLRSHGGDVALLRIADGVAYVKLEGACNGCSMAAATLRELVEAALTDGVPGLERVEVLPNDPPPTLIPLESIRIGRDPGAQGWVRIGPAADVPDGQITSAGLNTPSGGNVEVILVHLDGRIGAYRNECAHQALPLDNAVLDVSSGTLTCPWHGFCYDATSGECLTAPGAQLERLPLRVDASDVWVRVTS